MPGKKYKNVVKEFELDGKEFLLEDALDLVPKLKTAKFNETVELHFSLGVDPKKSDQNIRGMVSLPAGTGKDVRVLVFAKGDMIQVAKEAGADFIGDEENVAKIKSGWFEFDVCIATPDMMGVVGQLGRLLGPRGLMPNPKLGTVTNDIEKTIKDMKSGRVEYRVDKFANIHVPVGKSDFAKEDLKKNIFALTNAIVKARPSSAKGQYMKSCYLALTMSPSVKVNVTNLTRSAAGI
ncbi:MAG: 50S ribosomal protein L1 [Caldisericia bacterium]|nr:50S ribosomal protein L1 [Caldisericia bacterium]MDD4614252.1 50S ribosomal protein L1 [Caldisericia bacterium]